MNDFEKGIIGVARTDQALNKVNNIVGAVVFGLTALGFIGVVLYIRSKKPVIAASGKAPQGAAKPGSAAASDPANISRADKISAITNTMFAASNLPKGLTPAQIDAQKAQILANINGLTDDELSSLYFTFVTTKQAADKLAATGVTLNGKSQAERTKILSDIMGISPDRVNTLSQQAIPTILKAVAGT